MLEIKDDNIHKKKVDKLSTKVYLVKKTLNV